VGVFHWRWSKFCDVATTTSSDQSARVDKFVANAKIWPNEIAQLRTLLLRTGLEESMKWGKPCYSAEGNNIAIIQEMKSFLALMFFKGALLADPKGVLESQGPNSRSAMRVCITSPADVRRLSPTIKALVASAIQVEKSGAKVEAAPPLQLVEELAARLAKNAKLRKAFEGLTPGRQREYNLHFAAAKQSATRESRIDKCAPQILAGKGLRDRV